MTKQTRLGIQNSKRSPRKVRKLSPEELGIPTGPEGGQSEEDPWEELRSEAASVASGSGTGAAVRTNNGSVVTGISLDGGASRDVHALELAVWKGYEATQSPVVDVAIMDLSMDIPCGRCLQVLADYTEDQRVTIQVTDGNSVSEYSLAELLRC